MGNLLLSSALGNVESGDVLLIALSAMLVINIVFCIVASAYTGSVRKRKGRIVESYKRYALRAVSTPAVTLSPVTAIAPPSATEADSELAATDAEAVASASSEGKTVEEMFRELLASQRHFFETFFEQARSRDVTVLGVQASPRSPAPSAADAEDGEDADDTGKAPVAPPDSEADHAEDLAAVRRLAGVYDADDEPRSERSDAAPAATASAAIYEREPAASDDADAEDGEAALFGLRNGMTLDVEDDVDDEDSMPSIDDAEAADDKDGAPSDAYERGAGYVDTVRRLTDIFDAHSAPRREQPSAAPAAQPTAPVAAQRPTPSVDYEEPAARGDAEDEEAVAFSSSSGKTFDEAFEELSDVHKRFYNELFEYAMFKDKTRAFYSKSGVQIKSNSKRLVKFRIRGGVIESLFVLENDLLKRFREANAKSGVKIAVKPTKIQLNTLNDFNTAKGMIDVTYEQIQKELIEEREARKARRAEKRRKEKEDGLTDASSEE